MSVLWIREFQGGLDTRRLPVSTDPGALVVASDGHVTRGGEFEKRAAFVPTYTLPIGTVGLAAGKSTLTVFGSDGLADVPVGIAYQQLASSGLQLVDVPSYDLYQGKIYAVGEFIDGSVEHFYDGAIITDWFDGRARAAFTIDYGVASPSSTLTDLTVDGVSIIAAPVTWAGSTVAMAAAIAAAINSDTTTPDYTATSVDNRVNVVAADAGAAANGKIVVPTGSNQIVISPASTITMANGTDAANTYQPGVFVRTLSSQEFSVSGPNVHFSGVGEPTKWTTDTTGAGFIDMSSQESGSEQLYALGKYGQYLAIFAERVIQIWVVDTDPTNDKQFQVLNNTGTASPRSVTQFGDSDLFYLDESGLRSLKARDASGSAATTDIGVPIDTIVSSKLNTFTDYERAHVIGVIEPQESRFWLIMKDTIYVFSFFSGAKVSAWTVYYPTNPATGEALDISDAVVFQRRVYVRSGDTIYCYAGQGVDPIFDETIAEAWPPYLNADAPTQEKQWKGLDVACTGHWHIEISTDPVNTDPSEPVAELTKTTFGGDTIPLSGNSTHIQLRFSSRGNGPCVLSSAVLRMDRIENGED